MLDSKDDDEEEAKSEATEKGESPCSMLLMLSLRLYQIMSPCKTLTVQVKDKPRLQASNHLIFANGLQRLSQPV